jgi:hypothetical protein
MDTAVEDIYEHVWRLLAKYLFHQNGGCTHYNHSPSKIGWLDDIMLIHTVHRHTYAIHAVDGSSVFKSDTCSVTVECMYEYCTYVHKV